jgi:hypothetical protein
VVDGPLIGSEGGGLNLGAANGGRCIWRWGELHRAACRPEEDDDEAVSGGWVGLAIGFGLVGWSDGLRSGKFSSLFFSSIPFVFIYFLFLIF